MLITWKQNKVFFEILNSITGAGIGKALFVTVTKDCSYSRANFSLQNIFILTKWLCCQLYFKTLKWVTKIPKWSTKMLKLVTRCSIFVAKNTGIFNFKIYFLAFLHQYKNAGIWAFMKLTPEVSIGPLLIHLLLWKKYFEKQHFYLYVMES